MWWQGRETASKPFVFYSQTWEWYWFLFLFLLDGKRISLFPQMLFKQCFPDTQTSQTVVRCPGVGLCDHFSNIHCDIFSLFGTPEHSVINTNFSLDMTVTHYAASKQCGLYGYILFESPTKTMSCVSISHKRSVFIFLTLCFWEMSRCTEQHKLCYEYKTKFDSEVLRKVPELIHCLERQKKETDLNRLHIALTPDLTSSGKH